MTTPRATVTLRNINLLVQDVDRSRRFYETVLGLVLDARRSVPPAMLILQTEGCTLSLKDRATEEAEKLAGPGDVELGFETADLDAVHVAMTAFSVTVTPITELGFGRTFDANDPDGHHLVVYTLRAAHW